MRNCVRMQIRKMSTELRRLAALPPASEDHCPLHGGENGLVKIVGHRRTMRLMVCHFSPQAKGLAHGVWEPLRALRSQRSQRVLITPVSACPSIPRSKSRGRAISRQNLVTDTDNRRTLIKTPRRCGTPRLLTYEL